MSGQTFYGQPSVLTRWIKHSPFKCEPLTHPCWKLTGNPPPDPDPDCLFGSYGGIADCGSIWGHPLGSAPSNDGLVQVATLVVVFPLRSLQNFLAGLA